MASGEKLGGRLWPNTKVQQDRQTTKKAEIKVLHFSDNNTFKLKNVN
jgi:hypothetical protein